MLLTATASPEVITTFENYGLTWLVYIGFVFLMVAIIWWAFRKSHFILNWLIASVIFAGALTVGHPAENIQTYSPLILNGVVQLFDDNTSGFISAIKTIVMVWLVIFLTGVAAWFGFKKFLQPQDNKSNDDSQMATPIEPELKE